MDRISVSIPGALRKEVRRAAAKQGISSAEYMRLATMAMLYYERGERRGYKAAMRQAQRR